MGDVGRISRANLSWSFGVDAAAFSIGSNFSYIVWRNVCLCHSLMVQGVELLASLELLRTVMYGGRSRNAVVPVL